MIGFRLFFLIYFVKKELMKQKLIQPKIILLVGMMGAGKTSLGRIVARRLGLPFLDSDKEIEMMRKVNDDKYSLLKCVDISQYEF